MFFLLFIAQSALNEWYLALWVVQITLCNTDLVFFFSKQGKLMITLTIFLGIILRLLSSPFLCLAAVVAIKNQMGAPLEEITNKEHHHHPRCTICERSLMAKFETKAFQFY